MTKVEKVKQLEALIRGARIEALTLQFKVRQGLNLRGEDDKLQDMLEQLRDCLNICGELVDEMRSVQAGHTTTYSKPRPKRGPSEGDGLLPKGF